MTIDNEPQLPRFVDMRELERRLCLKSSAIYEMFARGELTRIKLGPKKTVVLEQELSALIQRKFQEARQRVSA